MSESRIGAEQLRRWATAALCNRSLEHGEVFRRAADTIEALTAEVVRLEREQMEHVEEQAAALVEAVVFSRRLKP